MRQHTSAYVELATCREKSAYVSIHQHTSAYVSIRRARNLSREERKVKRVVTAIERQIEGDAAQGPEKAGPTLVLGQLSLRAGSGM
jgi:hypothetical protein